MKKSYYLLSFIFCLTGFFAEAQKLPSADAIIARYVKVIGGEKQWAAIKTSEFHATATIGDKSLDVLVVKAGPGKYFQSMEGSGLSIMEVYDSGKAISIQNGDKRQITDTIMLDNYQLQSKILPDMNYRQLNYERQLVGIEDVNGIPCYKIILTSKNGSININYYEKKSGLLTVVEKDRHKTFLTDYKFYKGCSIPFTMTEEIGQGTNIIIKVTDWLVNQKSSVTLFNAKKQQVQLK